MSEHQKNDDPNSCDDYQFNSETQRLHESEVCDELFDENYSSFNWKLYKRNHIFIAQFSLLLLVFRYRQVFGRKY